MNYHQKLADVLFAALVESLALNENWVSTTDPENLVYYSEYRAVIKQAKEAVQLYQEQNSASS